MAVVTLRKVVKYYDETLAVRGIDLEIADEEFIVLVGPSGCGKTTTLRMIAGLEDITDGEVLIGDVVVNDVPPKDRNIAMVFQNYALYPHMSVYENMSFGLKLKRVPKDSIDRSVQEAARILDIVDLLDRKPKQLSGGQRQRVAMGRAIVRNPAVFLFDEPLSNLDAELRVDKRVEIARLHKEIGATMIYVTHDQVEAMTLADKIVVLRAGRIEQVGAPMELYRNPDNRFVAGFIGSPSMNFLKGKVTAGGVEVPGLGGEVIPASVALPGLGSEVIVGIRPQEATLRHEPSSLKVDITEQLGGVAYEYLSTPTGEALVIESKGDDAIKAGTEVRVGYDASRVMFFDAKTEARLR